MRHDYEAFAARDAEILTVNPEQADAVAAYWEREQFPFVGLADPRHRVAKLYGQRVNWLQLGRMPALVVVDKRGRIRWRHFGDSMGDIPPNEQVLAILDELQHESPAQNLPRRQHE